MLEIEAAHHHSVHFFKGIFTFPRRGVRSKSKMVVIRSPALFGNESARETTNSQSLHHPTINLSENQLIVSNAFDMRKGTPNSGSSPSKHYSPDEDDDESYGEG